jgi:hypothetical protein
MVYFAQLPGGSVKIGYTETLDARLDQLRAHYGAELALLATMPGDRSVEAEIHDRFAHLRFGRTEQFKPAADLMEFIGRPLLVDANPDAVEATQPLPGLIIIAVTIRGSEEWKAWIEAGARYCRTDVAKLIDAAVVDYLRARGFGQEAPDR